MGFGIPMWAGSKWAGLHFHKQGTTLSPARSRPVPFVRSAHHLEEPLASAEQSAQRSDSEQAWLTASPAAALPHPRVVPRLTG